MFRGKWTTVVALLGASIVAQSAVAATPAGASTPGVTRNTITLGLITELTGPASAETTGMVPSAEARIALQNAEGGVDGRKIKLIVKDDQTSPAADQSASAALVSEGVFGVLDESAVTFGGYKLLQQRGIPVTGGAYDGPEWYQQPNTNMFSFTGPGDAKDPQYTNTAVFAKEHGGTKCGSVGYAISPSSQASATGFDFACAKEGLKNAYLNNSLPFGSINVTTLVLQLKAAGVNALYLPLDENTNFAIMTALKQAGVNMKVIINATGYGQSLVTDTSAAPDAQGAWFLGTGAPVELKSAATKSFQAALKKYAHYTGVPDFSWYEGWGSADLMIKGLELAGRNPTQANFISALHKVSSYDVNGIENPVNLTLARFGKAPTKLCEYLTQFKGDAFVNPTNVCGSLIPNSDQLPSA